MKDLIDDDDVALDDRYILQDRYLDLTRRLLPAEAHRRGWVLKEDHCFMRIVLDHVFSDCWYNHLDRPLTAYKQLNVQQLREAVALAEEMLREGECFVMAMNDKSLNWRGHRNADSLPEHVRC